MGATASVVTRGPVEILAFRNRRGYYCARLRWTHWVTDDGLGEDAGARWRLEFDRTIHTGFIELADALSYVGEVTEEVMQGTVPARVIPV